MLKMPLHSHSQYAIHPKSKRSFNSASDRTMPYNDANDRKRKPTTIPETVSNNHDENPKEGKARKVSTTNASASTATVTILEAIGEGESIATRVVARNNRSLRERRSHNTRTDAVSVDASVVAHAKSPVYDEEAKPTIQTFLAKLFTLFPIKLKEKASVEVKHPSPNTSEEEVFPDPTDHVRAARGPDEANTAADLNPSTTHATKVIDTFLEACIDDAPTVAELAALPLRCDIAQDIRSHVPRGYRIPDLVQDKAALTVKTQELLKELTAMTERAAELESSASDSEVQRQGLNAKLDALQTQVGALETQLAETNQERDNIQSELDASNEKVNEMEAIIAYSDSERVYPYFTRVYDRTIER
jgi:hypothetical protein